MKCIGKRKIQFDKHHMVFSHDVFKETEPKLRAYSMELKRGAEPWDSHLSPCHFSKHVNAFLNQIQ